MKPESKSCEKIEDESNSSLVNPAYSNGLLYVEESLERLSGGETTANISTHAPRGRTSKSHNDISRSTVICVFIWSLVLLSVSLGLSISAMTWIKCKVCKRPRPKGNQGPIGSYGLDGPRGPDGLPGPIGPRGIPGSDVYGPENGGTSYIRWGGLSCGNVSELVYAGLAGGGFFAHTGASANYLCLPHTPEYDEPDIGVQVKRGSIYNGEYKTADFPPFMDNNARDVPCALCYISNRSTVVMIPATMTCPLGWMQAYQGYLMGSRYSYRRASEVVCVDGSHVTESNSSATADFGTLFLPIESRCTDENPCDPYIEGYELTCVVCTK